MADYVRQLNAGTIQPLSRPIAGSNFSHHQALYRNDGPVTADVHPFTQLEMLSVVRRRRPAAHQKTWSKRGFNTQATREKVATAYGQIGIEMVGYSRALMVVALRQRRGG
jgi:hypothetical protein